MVEPPSSLTDDESDDRSIATSETQEEPGNRQAPLDPEIMTDDEKEEFAEEVSRRLMMTSSWSGRLPRPSDLREYDAIVPGAAEKLVDDVVYETQLARESIELDKRVSDVVLDIMKGQHDLAVEQSQDDRSFRDNVFNWLKPLFYLPLVVVVLILFAPIDDWVKAVIAVSVIAAYVAPVCIVLLKGSMSDNEKEVLSSVVPAVVSAVRKELRSPAKIEPGEGSDALPENASENNR
jgi:hypothetical protein